MLRHSTVSKILLKPGLSMKKCILITLVVYLLHVHLQKQDLLIILLKKNLLTIFKLTQIDIRSLTSLITSFLTSLLTTLLTSLLKVALSTDKETDESWDIFII